MSGSEPPPYTAAAVEALSAAHAGEHDFAGWLAAVLASVAARLGSVAALTAGRPGSWEAGLVDQLVAGTVGYEGEDLDAYRIWARASPGRSWASGTLATGGL